MALPSPASAAFGLAAGLERITEALLSEGRVRLVGAVGASGAAVAAHVAQSGRPVVYVVADDEAAEARLGDLGFFLGEPPASDDPLSPPAVLLLPNLDSSPYAEVQPDRRTIMRRQAVLYRLAHGIGPRALVASAGALARRVVPRGPFEARCGLIAADMTVDREALVQDLLGAGYARAQVVEDPGTFAVRGAVLDLFPPVYRHPVRVELFGDEVESVRLYDAATQRTLRALPRVVFHPVRETFRSPGADPRARLLAAADAAALPSTRTRALIDQIEEGEDFFGIESLAPIFHGAMVPVLDYLPADAVYVLEDPEALWEDVGRTFARLGEVAAHRRAEHRLALDPGDFFLQDEELMAALRDRAQAELRALEITGQATPIRLLAEPNTGLRAELAERRAHEPPAEAEEGTDLGRALRDRLKTFVAEGFRVKLIAPNKTHADRLSGVLEALKLPARVRAAGKRARSPLEQILEDGPAGVEIMVGPLTQGFRLPADRLVLIAEEEVFGRRAHREARPGRAGGLGDLAEIGEGDLIVHEEHGIGRYRGLKKIAVRGVAQDFLHLEYDGGTIYLPVYRIGVVRRYVGGPGESARLDKLGGKTWQEKRRKVSAEARKVAEELLQLYAQRKALPGHRFSAPDVVFHEFEETFPFEETPDQAKAIEAVIEDMQAPTPMDRLICGDVGYGKTEVALRAALLAVLGGKQVAVLAPTTVLAEQHFVTFSERLREFPVRLGSLSRFRTPQEQRRTVVAIAEGKLDIVIGTHRLLSKDVRFKDLGLIVVDEEQRFGVVHKERLKEMRSQVDVLTLTATPIPRTLQMAMSGLREISIIATPPVDRLAIRTLLCHWDKDLLSEAIHKELARGGQVFFVHNRVEDLAKWKKEVEALAPNAKVGMAHGQMGESELEKAMVDFVDGRYDILCCTTIVESGLDIPRANTMIVNQADRYGLAQLYQLRGRIGRSKERAFCYLVVPAERALTPEAKQRLEVLQRFTELGAGFQVATHDLEIRGAGDLLGDRQHGLVAAVGFDTYARLLEEAVAELRGQPIKQEHDPEITVDVPAFLPDDYIPDTGQRLDLYRRFAQARGEDEIRDIQAELEDRYGPLPEEAGLLAEVMAHKTLVRKVGALSYELGPVRMVLGIGQDTPLDPAKVMRLVQRSGGRWKLSPDMRLSYAFDDRERNDRLAAARERLGEVQTCLP